MFTPSGNVIKLRFYNVTPSGNVTKLRIGIYK